MSATNLESYNSSHILKWYKDLKDLIQVEKLVFESYRERLPDFNVLDIGIGGGRTTDFLINHCRTYTGIDYSQGFVTIVKQKHPNKNIHQMDARDLSAFEAHSFDFVNFSFNGIDYVNNEGREKVLSEVYRVLRPGGIFFFSTHNKTHKSFGKNPWSDPLQDRLTNFKTFAKLLLFYPRHLLNRKREIYEKNYAIINDSAHNYGLFTFYTSPGFLRERLTKHGYKEIKLLSKNGFECEQHDLDDWIFVTCIKSAS